MTMNLLKLIRQIHLYLGIFVAPSVLFFAFTGAMQTFSLHESAKSSDYRPPEWIVALAQIHKKQTLQLPRSKSRPTEAPQAGDPHSHKHIAHPAFSAAPAQGSRLTHNPLPLKFFFLIVSIGLCFSTFSGLYMAFKYNRSRIIVGIVLLAGIVIPILLLTVI